MLGNIVPESTEFGKSAPIEGREAAERFYDLLTRGSGAALHWRLIPRKDVGGPIHEPIFPLARFFEKPAYVSLLALRSLLRSLVLNDGAAALLGGLP